MSTANQVIAAVNAEGTYTARVDPTETGNDGSDTVQATQTHPQATTTTADGP